MKAREALAAHAANLLERAEAMERENMPQAPQPATPQQPIHQQQQVQPKEERVVGRPVRGLAGSNLKAAAGAGRRFIAFKMTVRV